MYILCVCIYTYIYVCISCIDVGVTYRAHATCTHTHTHTHTHTGVTYHTNAVPHAPHFHRIDASDTPEDAPLPPPASYKPRGHDRRTGVQSSQGGGEDEPTEAEEAPASAGWWEAGEAGFGESSDDDSDSSDSSDEEPPLGRNSPLKSASPVSPPRSAEGTVVGADGAVPPAALRAAPAAPSCDAAPVLAALGHTTNGVASADASVSSCTRSLGGGGEDGNAAAAAAAAAAMSADTSEEKGVAATSDRGRRPSVATRLLKAGVRADEHLEREGTVTVEGCQRVQVQSVAAVTPAVSPTAEETGGPGNARASALRYMRSNDEPSTHADQPEDAYADLPSAGTSRVRSRAGAAPRAAAASATELGVWASETSNTAVSVSRPRSGEALTEIAVRVNTILADDAPACPLPARMRDVIGCSDGAIGGLVKGDGRVDVSDLAASSRCSSVGAQGSGVVLGTSGQSLAEDDVTDDDWM